MTMKEAGVRKQTREYISDCDRIGVFVSCDNTFVNARGGFFPTTKIVCVFWITGVDFVSSSANLFRAVGEGRLFLLGAALSAASYASSTFVADRNTRERPRRRDHLQSFAFPSGMRKEEV